MKTLSPRRRKAGFILPTGLMFLVLLSLLAAAMARNAGLQEVLAGNTREKQRAFEAAQTALQYGERWLALGAPGLGVPCSSAGDDPAPAALHVCSNPLADAAALPWAYRFEYSPPAMTVAGGGGLAADGDVNYAARPGLYVHYLGMTPDGQGQLYQVSAFAQGGRADTAAVVQSTYRVWSGVKDLGQE